MRKNFIRATSSTAIVTVLAFQMLSGSANSLAITDAARTLPSNQIQIDFNADFIEDLTAPPLDLEERDAVLEAIFSARPGGLDVYPSEGYYYFTFNNKGENVKGNFRFGVEERDEGTFSFIYYRELANASEGRSQDYFHQLGQDGDGVELIKNAEFQYEIRFKDFIVPVRIYDAALELAAPKSIGPQEEYIGPAFDESGTRFHLIFDHGSDKFLYVLNEMFGHPESYSALDDTNVILLGTRSRFAYFNDKDNDRYVLIGVSGRNVDGNNYYDGPFDQLPDSFVDPNYLKDLIEKFEPRAVGKIGPFGVFLEEEDARYAISPYVEYYDSNNLLKYLDCLDVKDNRTALNTCLTTVPT